MKYFKKNRTNIVITKIAETFVLFLRIVFRIFHFVLFKRGRPAIVLVDGLNIGDAVLLRPLIISIIERYEKTHDIIVISGSFSKYIYEDILSRINILELQFIWSHLFRSPRHMLTVCKTWLRLFAVNVEIAIETRGDFRSIAWMALACPSARLIGFDFTGGERLLTDVVPDDGQITHLFTHIQRLGKTIGVDVSKENIAIRSVPLLNEKPRIGISFAGHQEMKNIPHDTGIRLLKELIQIKGDADLWYIGAPQGDPLPNNVIENEFGNAIKIFKGNFYEYFIFLQTLNCYVGMDSGGGHLCSMFAIPSVIIFGMYDPSFCSPLGTHQLLCIEGSGKLDCKPCGGDVCINPIYKECLRNIDTVAILDFVKTTLIPFPNQVLTSLASSLTPHHTKQYAPACAYPHADRCVVPSSPPCYPPDLETELSADLKHFFMTFLA
ncbi:MAG: hypothetical protein WCJ49_03700 [Deltaproteobacteria bacterium]